MTNKTPEELQAKIHELEEDFFELKRKVENIYTPLIELTNEALFFVDKECTYLFITNTMAVKLGAPLHEIIGKKYGDFHKPDVTRAFEERVAEVFATGRTIADEHKASSDNKYIYRTFHPVKTTQGEVIKVAVIGQDITERKQMEETLRKSEEKYRSIVENLKEGIFQRYQGRFLTVNKAFADILGYTSPEDVIETITDTSRQLYVHPEDLIRVRKILDERNSVKDFETEVYRKDGSRIWVSISSQAIRDNRDNKGQILYFQGICEDITLRKQLDEELKQSLSLLRASLESTVDGLLIVDREGRVTNCNQKFLKMWNIPEHLAKSRDDSMLLNYVLGQLIEPQQFLEKVEQLYVGPMAHSMDILELKDGRTFERHSQPQLLGDEPIGRVWSFRDITERKLAENALQESEAKYHDLYENAPDMHYSIETKTGVIVECNKMFLRATGFSKEEVLGRPIFEFYHEDCIEDAKGKFQKFGHAAEIHDVERRVKRKDGSIMDVSLSVSAVRGKDGNVIFSRSTWRDSTERKKYEGIINALSITDQMTGLYNRRGFITLAEQQLRVAERTKNGMLLLYADMDGLKQINDNLGHKAGDEALVETASVLKEVFRKMDIIARVGGDEFAILAPEVSMKYSDMVKNRLRDQLDRHNACTGRNFNISISVGTAYYDPENPCSLDELISRADSLMYKQKKNYLSRLS